MRDALSASPTAVITLRDRQGVRLLEDAGVSREIQLTADPAFLLEPQELSVEALKAEGVNLEGPVVGFSVRRPAPSAPAPAPGSSG